MDYSWAAISREKCDSTPTLLDRYLGGDLPEALSVSSDRVLNLPSTPGVYAVTTWNDILLYGMTDTLPVKIGMSKNLRSRVAEHTRVGLAHAIRGRGADALPSGVATMSTSPVLLLGAWTVEATACVPDIVGTGNAHRFTCDELRHWAPSTYTFVKNPVWGEDVEWAAAAEYAAHAGASETESVSAEDCLGDAWRLWVKYQGLESRGGAFAACPPGGELGDAENSWDVRASFIVENEARVAATWKLSKRDNPRTYIPYLDPENGRQRKLVGSEVVGVDLPWLYQYMEGYTTFKESVFRSVSVLPCVRT